MKVLGVVGYKNCGKTTLIVRLIPELAALGISVSTIKHVHHAIDLDQPGKDTFAHREAGAVDVAILSDRRWAILHERPIDSVTASDLDDVLRRLSPVDLVLAEGFKSLPMPRIELRMGNALLAPAGDKHTLAVVSDDELDTALPRFRRDDIPAIAAFIADFTRPARPST
jgi:molybdopterin-guanine dinucleotide biosynthesis protein B